MGCKDLIGALRSKADRQTCAVWDKAESEVAKIWAETREKIACERLEASEAVSVRTGAKRRAALFLAERKAASIIANAESRFAETAFMEAQSLLPSLRDDQYEAILGKLLGELPDLDWTTVKLHPKDIPVVRPRFSNASIVPDSGISGGVEAHADGGRIRVVNTFEKRLERAWADILPGLMGTVRKEVDVTEHS